MKIINLKTLLFILGLMVSTISHAQVISLSGSVTDASTGEALPGVTIVEKETMNGTITNPDGHYTIQVRKGALIQFSYVGYKPAEHPAGESAVLNVALEEDMEQLEEVVVIGYGQVKKGDLTGSVTSVGAGDFNKGTTGTPQDLILGKVAGVQIITEGGAPGSSATIRIRGGSSMSASNDPLIVVDGMPVDNRSVSGMSNILGSLNPADIETFTVLKDASATAIYGSRASNGVIMITTKKGKKGQDFQVGADYKFSLGQIKETIDVLSAEEFTALVGERALTNPSVNPALLGDSSTDWQDEIFRTSTSHDVNAGVSGSLGDIPFRASFGYTDQEGILKTSSMNRKTALINLNPDFLNDHLKVNLGVKANWMENRFADKAAVGNALRFDPTKPVMDPDPKYDIYGGYYTWLMSDGTRNVNGTRNPVAQLFQRADRSDVSRIMGDLKIDYKFHFFPEMTATMIAGLDYSEGEGTIVTDPMASWAQAASVGLYREYSQEKKNELFDFYLNYQKDLPSVESRLEVMGGYEWQHSRIKSSAWEIDKDMETLEDSKDDTENYLVSFFGRLNYSLMDKYLFTATLRQDGSSRFSSGNKWGTFPSLALAWRISEEPFLKNAHALSNLKLRLGYGITGQQELNSGDYPYLGTYRLSDNRTQYQFGDTFYPLIRPNGYDKTIKWEETTTYNVALDFGFLGGRINGSVEAYKKETKDLLNVVPVPAGTNFTDRLLTNVGNLENQGIEFTLDATPINKKDFAWQLGFNLAWNKNKVTKLTNYDDPAYKGVEVGRISGVGVGNYIQVHAVGHPIYTFYVYEQVYGTDGKPIEGLYVDRNKDGEISLDDKYYAKDPLPDVSMGFSSTFNYKKFDFGFNGRVLLGNYVYNNVIVGARYQELTVNQYLTNMPSEINYSKFETAQQYSDYFLEDASFLRLDNATLGYSFNIGNDLIKMRCYATVQNVFVITDYKGLDPEIQGGIDNDVYPRPRTFMLGISANF